MIQKAFGEAGSQVVVEERLRGFEVSIFAFCDGEKFALMPPVQDHKRLLDGDAGVNTGGMGAVVTPWASKDTPHSKSFLSEEEQETIRQTIIEPTLKGMREEGNPFVGVLYAGLMITEDGPKVGKLF